MARPRNEDLHQQRRKEILKAAARMFKLRGFHRTRTDDICKEAGLSAGTVFRYFSSKQEMILAIASMEFEHYKAQTISLASREGLLRLSRITGKELDTLFAPSECELSTDSWLELSRTPELCDEINRIDMEQRGILAQALGQGQQEGWVSPHIDPEGMTTLIFAILGGISFDRETGTKLDADATARAIADFVKRLVLA